MKYHISDVDWDTDGEDVDLPTEFDVEVDTITPDVEEYLSDWLSNETGFCHNGFSFSKIEQKGKIMSKSEFQSVFDSVVESLENGGLAVSEEDDSTVCAETADGHTVKITIEPA